MKIYHQVTKYSPDTGQPYLFTEFKEIRCDFSGKVIDEDLNNHSYPNYILDYGEQDSCFGSDGDEFHFGKKYGIDMHEFLCGEYHFFTSGYDEDDNYIDYNACVDMMKNYLNGDDTLDFANMCRCSRIKTALKLINDGIIKPEQL